MTKIAIPIMVQSFEQALGASVEAERHGADLVEFRIDQFVEPDQSDLALQALVLHSYWLRPQHLQAIPGRSFAVRIPEG